jgi:hypothetical protein
MQIENYIQPGDGIAVMYRSLTLDGFRGTVAEVCPGELGRREIIIVREGTTLMDAGAVGVLESSAVFSVRRGDSWVNVPLPLLIEEASAKVARMNANERKRIEKTVPLFADQIELQERSAARWVINEMASDREKLERDHAACMVANETRALVEALINADDAAYLRERRERYPKDATYGIMFWRKQLLYIQEHGEIERIVYLPSLNKTLKIDWLKHDAELTWATCANGPQKVVVHFIGSDAVMCQLTGEAKMRADARNQSNHVWLKPEDFAEFAPANTLTQPTE